MKRLAAHVAHEANRRGLVVRLDIRPAAPNGHTWANVGAHGAAVAPILSGPLAPVCGRPEKNSDRVYIHLKAPVSTRFCAVQARVAETKKTQEN